MLDRMPSLRWIAARVGMTERTLQRQLAAKGTPFSDLVRGALLQRAFELLLDDSRSITQIAAQLDYSDAAHFSRAFRRWTGLSPQAWRERA